MSASTLPHNCRRIFLWSTRRVLSTALQRAIFQLEANGIENMVHYFQPFANSFYLGSKDEPRRSKQFNVEAAKELGMTSLTIDQLLQRISQFDGKFVCQKEN